MINHLASPSDKAGLGPVTIEKFSLPLTRRGRGVFCQVEFHVELANLAFERRDLDFVLRDDRCLSPFGAELTLHRFHVHRMFGSV